MCLKTNNLESICKDIVFEQSIFCRGILGSRLHMLRSDPVAVELTTIAAMMCGIEVDGDASSGH